MSPSKDCIDIYFQDLGEMKPLSREEESKLAIKVQKGNKKAKDALIRANLRLVVSIARKYNHMGLSFLDIIEEGNLGLIKAAEKFDLSFDCKFSTYAAWWIKQKIMRALANHGKMIRIPAYMVDRIILVRRLSYQLKNVETGDADIEEIAKAAKLTVEQVEETFKISKGTASLNEPIGSEGGAELMDLIEDLSYQSPSVNMEVSLIKDKILDLLEVLNEREVKLVVYRFGLFNNTPHTLEAIGKQMGITRERVRQLEKVAIKKMKENFKDGSFHDFGFFSRK